MMAAASTAPTTTAATETIDSGNTHINGHLVNLAPLQLEEAQDYTDVKEQPLETNYGNNFRAGGSSHNAERVRSALNTESLVDETSSPSIGYTRHGLGGDDGERWNTDTLTRPNDYHHSLAAGENKRSIPSDLYGGGDPDDENSKWIHRDKLARIESEELQAAGIILPKTHPRSKPRRDPSSDRVDGHGRNGSDADGAVKPRPRMDPAGFQDRREHDTIVASTPTSGWDLRLPDEIAEEAHAIPSISARTISRIPVAKLSPVPIPQEHMEREMPMARRRDDSPEESIVYPKTRSRSASMRSTDLGTTLAATGSGSAQRGDHTARPTSEGPKKANNNTSSTTSRRPPRNSGRPRTRGGPAKDNKTTRPSTRSGEREVSSGGAASKQPEGDPPWLISAYRPDPRLPPEQQLIPTVARRLQQEKWEREGKFGNIYDKEFRPLTDEGFTSLASGPAEKAPVKTDSSEPAAAATDEEVNTFEKHAGWPLKPEAKSPTGQSGRAGSYSTIPKIQERPPLSPLPSPRVPVTSQPDTSPRRTQGLPEHKDETNKGCGCCIIM